MCRTVLIALILWHMRVELRAFMGGLCVLAARH